MSLWTGMLRSSRLVTRCRSLEHPGNARRAETRGLNTAAVNEVVAGAKPPLGAEQRVITRLLGSRMADPRTPYDLLPRVGEAPDLLTNPRLAALATPIDPRLLAPFYPDIDAHNARLRFFSTGNQTNPRESFYMRSFMPHCHTSSNRFYIKPRDGLSPEPENGILPWQPLGELLTGMFQSVGVTEFRDFYTHVLPGGVGRHNAHRDQLQSGTWKVTIRFCSEWTDLLVLDDVDGRWYALRFPPGGSGYVIDSALYGRFHAVRAGAAIQQSVLAVFNKQASTQETVRAALARLAATATTAAADAGFHSGDHSTHTIRNPTGASLASTVSPTRPSSSLSLSSLLASPSFTPLTLPAVSGPHPRTAENARVTTQTGQHVRNCLQTLRASVATVAPAVRQTRGWLSRVSREVIEQAAARMTPDVRADVLRVYANSCKRIQHVASGAQLHTAARQRASIQRGRLARRVLDDRLVSIHGTVSVGGATLHFRDDDGTDATRLRFSWNRHAKHYYMGVSTDSGHEQARSLALLAKTLNLPHQGTTQYRVILQFDGDTITGNHAERLRGLGLSLRVVHVAGELDHHTKRLRELERRTRKRTLGPTLRERRPTKRRSPWLYFLQDHLRLAKAEFNGLSASARQVYEQQAEEDRLRYQTLASQMPARPSRPLSAWLLFVKGNPNVATGESKGRMRAVVSAFKSLTAQQREVYETQAQADLLRYRTQMDAWNKANPEGRVKRQRSAWSHFLQDYYNSAKKMFENLDPEKKKVYEVKAESDRRRFNAQLSDWRLENQKAPTTAFEVFQAESGPDPKRHTDSEGQHRLTRELRAQWQRLGPSGWAEYETKLQHQLVAHGT